jgi:hypothetical protein
MLFDNSLNGFLTKNACKTELIEGLNSGKISTKEGVEYLGKLSLSEQDMEDIYAGLNEAWSLKGMYNKFKARKGDTAAGDQEMAASRTQRDDEHDASGGAYVEKNAAQRKQLADIDAKIKEYTAYADTKGLDPNEAARYDAAAEKLKSQRESLANVIAAGSTAQTAAEGEITKQDEARQEQAKYKQGMAAMVAVRKGINELFAAKSYDEMQDGLKELKVTPAFGILFKMMQAAAKEA